MFWGDGRVIAVRCVFIPNPKPGGVFALADASGLLNSHSIRVVEFLLATEFVWEITAGLSSPVSGIPSWILSETSKMFGQIAR